MAMGLFEQLNWLTTRVKRLCCAVEQIQQSGAGSYKVYTALLTQSGGDDPMGIDTGTLIIGVTYLINNDSLGMDFTNVGAPNNNLSTYFVATGTVPNSWGANEGTGNATLVYNTGAPVATVLENTIGNIWFTYDNVGVYSVKSDGVFLQDKTVCSFLSTFPIQMLFNENVLVNFERSDNSTAPLAIGLDSFLSAPIEIRVYN